MLKKAIESLRREKEEKKQKKRKYIEEINRSRVLLKNIKNKNDNKMGYDEK